MVLMKMFINNIIIVIQEQEENKFHIMCENIKKQQLQYNPRIELDKIAYAENIENPLKKEITN